MSEGRVVDTILLDFGGVFTASPFSSAGEVADELGLDAGAVLELCFGPDVDGDHPWHCLERGELTFDEAHRGLLDLARERGLDVDPVEVLMRLGAEDDQRDAVVERVRTLRADGFRTALVTNNVAEFGDGWRGLIPIDELFDVVVDSCRVGVRKPSRRIFELALDELGAEAGRSVFLDDHPMNTSAAAALGMRTVLVGDDRLVAFDELDRLLGRSATTIGQTQV
jgi:putative hydrolase of the HAD superfamily